jgi:transposase
MRKRQRRKFTSQFKAETVRLIRAGNKPISQVARDLDLSESAVRAWVKQADIDAGRSPSGGELTTTEREELLRLRRENRQLEMEREILKKAAAFFAKESR